MSEIRVILPNNGWINNCDEIKPGYGELCLCISFYGKMPSFCQYRKADYLNEKYDYFLCLDELFLMSKQGAEDDWEPAFMGPVGKWKPLDLPEPSKNCVMELINRVIEKDTE